VFGLTDKAEIGGHWRGGSVSFECAAPSDNVVPARAKCLLFRSRLRWSRFRRRQARGKTIPLTAFPLTAFALQRSFWSVVRLHFDPQTAELCERAHIRNVRASRYVHDDVRCDSRRPGPVAAIGVA
jgi:hypothetical protein